MLAQPKFEPESVRERHMLAQKADSKRELGLVLHIDVSRKIPVPGTVKITQVTEKVWREEGSYVVVGDVVVKTEGGLKLYSDLGMFIQSVGTIVEREVEDLYSKEKIVTRTTTWQCKGYDFLTLQTSLSKQSLKIIQNRDSAVTLLAGAVDWWSPSSTPKYPLIIDVEVSKFGSTASYNKPKINLVELRELPSRGIITRLLPLGMGNSTAQGQIHLFETSNVDEREIFLLDQSGACDFRAVILNPAGTHEEQVIVNLQMLENAHTIRGSSEQVFSLGNKFFLVTYK